MKYISCLDCKISVPKTNGNIKRCKKCVAEVKAKRSKRYYEKSRQILKEEREKIPRNCLNCKNCIKHMHPNNKRCKECSEKERKNKQKLYLKNKISSNLKKKFCSDCEKCITYLHGRVKRCKKCGEKEIARKRKIYRESQKVIRSLKDPKICLDCKNHIVNRNRSAKRCKECSEKVSREKMKVRIRRYREDPKNLEIESIAAKKRYKKLLSTPEGIRKNRLAKQKSRQKRMSTSEGRKKSNEQCRLSRIKNTASTIRSKLRRRSRYKEAEKIGSLLSKQDLFDRQNGICPYTGVSMHGIPLNELHIDHIVPLVKEGTNTPGNLCLTFACANLSKGSKYLRDWIASPLYKPIVERCIKKEFA